MPLYLFANKDNTEVQEVFFHMNDEKIFIGPDGETWRRVYTVPQMSIDTHLDPRNKNEFIRRTEKYKTIGETIDKSRELSEKREAKDGVDSVKQKHFDDYAAARKGKRHPAEKAKKFENDRVSIDFTAKS